MSKIELAKAYVQIVPSAKGMNGSITEAIGGEASEAGTQAGGQIASSIKAAILAAAIGSVIKESISQGAALEQSIGGIETLFGAGGLSMAEYAESVGKNVAEVAGEYNNLMSAQEAMLTYADEAYKTAGLSANEYMETATSFAASLISSLDGDTKAAAEAANTAIIDMSDNANKMGTSMELIQNAYQGFAKQNYTMLDNLKLGYGGTKEEMERLLADAQALSGVEYNIENLNDIYEAIHVIQSDLGITGTTAKEAASTLSGSFASMAAAAKNFLGNLALGEDIQPSLEALISTTANFLTNNLVPMIMNIVSALPGAVGTLLNELPNMITNLVTNVGPQLFEVAISLIEQLTNGFVANIPTFINQVMPMLLSFTEYLRENAGLLIDAGLELIIQLVTGLMEGLPVLIEYLPQIIQNIVTTIQENLPKIVDAAITIIMALIDGIIQAVPALVENFDTIMGLAMNTMFNIDWFATGMEILGKIVSGLISVANAPVEFFTEVGNNIISAFKDGFSWSDLGSNIIDGIIEGLSTGLSAVIDAAESVAEAALDAAKDFLGIHSPSRVFRDDIGKMLDYGLAEGLIDNTNPISDAMKEITDMTINPIDTKINSTLQKGFNIPQQEINVVRDNDLEERYNRLMNAPDDRDIIIPVYIGQEMIEEIVVRAIDRYNYRSGGR